MNITIPKQVQEAEVIFVSHSGGKDSQAMLASLVRLGLKDKIVLVHSDLGEMEWEPMHNWIESISFGIPCNVVKAKEDFFEMCIRTKRLPSGRQQYCTDVLKTTPIAEFIHDYMYKNNIKTAINATGMRAEESKRRAEKNSFQISEMTQPKKHAPHLIHDWLPIFDYRLDDVLKEIKNAGQVPHKIYSMGFSRLSCVFCVNGRISEHKEAAKLRPGLAAKMSKLERDLGKAIRLKQIDGQKYPKYLDEYVELSGSSYCGDIEEEVEEIDLIAMIG